LQVARPEERRHDSESEVGLVAQITFGLSSRLAGC